VVARALNAVDRHLALVGFMGAGKSTLGPKLAERLGRLFVSVDEVVETGTGTTIEQLFAEKGEATFREYEEQAAAFVLGRGQLAVVELGGGALHSEATRKVLAESAFTVLVGTTPDEAWTRAAGSGMPLARDRDEFQVAYEQRLQLYKEVADADADDVETAVLAAAGVHVGEGILARLSELVPGEGPVELVVDAGIETLYGDFARALLADRLAASHVVPAGERAKTLDVAEQMGSSLRLDRSGTLVALGGGSTTDLAGFVAATYLRGVPWVPVPTTRIGQVDTAIGGKMAVELKGKNLVGAFHWPARVVTDPNVLTTLPLAEFENGLAEVVKTGLLAGEPLWELTVTEQVRRCAAFKAAVCLRDPYDTSGDRAQLNLGHTFAHALEAASGFSLSHGKAVALGLVAALRLSGLDEEARLVQRILRPMPVHVDRDAAWAALARDKKAEGRRPRLVLLEAPGKPRVGVELDPPEVRAALDALIQ
jgi:3-dehydroquinate synthetase